MKSMETIKKTIRDFNALEQRRRAGMALLAKGVYQSEVSRLVGVSRQTVMRWDRLRTETARCAWKRRRLGRPPMSRRLQVRGKRDHLSLDHFLHDRERLHCIRKMVKRECGVHIPVAKLERLLKEHGWPCMCEREA